METVSPYLLTFLLNALWEAPVVAAIAALACRLMRRSPAAHRHAVWVAALFAAIFLPVASIRTGEQTPELQLSPAIAISPIPPAPLANAPHTFPAPPATPSRDVHLAQTTATVILTLYFAFLVFAVARLAWSWTRTQRIRRGARPIVMPPAIEAVWMRSLKAFGLARIELLSSTEIDSPVTVGAWRKVVIIPEALLAETSEEVLTTAIGHEMAHIARRDFALNVIYEAVCLPIAFHPASWLTRREIARSREIACDELVTQLLLDRGIYARSMMSIAATMSAAARPHLTLGVFDGDILEERIRRLLDRRVVDLKRARLLLAGGLASLLLGAIVTSTIALTARAQSGLRAEMQLAGQAYNNGDFKTAVEHFDAAVRLDPSNTTPKLFLANALMREFFADKEPPTSLLLTHARQQYLDVLAYDGSSKQALEGLIAVSIYAQQTADARQWALKLIQADPKDKTGYYSAGVADWTMVYPEVQRARMQAAMKVTDYMITDAALRKSLRDKFMGSIDEGLRMLQTAISLDPDYSDAMAFVNLLDRVKSGLVDDPRESTQLIAAADDWVGKAIAAKRRAGNTVVSSLDVDGPPPGPASASAPIAAAPPPPPPPPPPHMPAATNQPASAIPPLKARNAAERPQPYWQVTASPNITAGALVRGLNAKGFNASLLGSREDPLVRVIVGPYADAQALEKAKGELIAAGVTPVRVW